MRHNALSVDVADVGHVVVDGVVRRRLNRGLLKPITSTSSARWPATRKRRGLRQATEANERAAEAITYDGDVLEHYRMYALSVEVIDPTTVGDDVRDRHAVTLCAWMSLTSVSSSRMLRSMLSKGLLKPITSPSSSRWPLRRAE